MCKCVCVYKISPTIWIILELHGTWMWTDNSLIKYGYNSDWEGKRKTNIYYLGPSQPQYYWHLGPDAPLLWGSNLIGCLTASLDSSHWMPVVFYHPSLNVKHVFRYCQMALRKRGQNRPQSRTTAVAVPSAWHALPLKGLIHALSPPPTLSAAITPLRLLWHIYLITQTLHLLTTCIPYPPLLFNFHDHLMYQKMYLFLCVCISFSYSNVSSLRAVLFPVTS